MIKGYAGRVLFVDLGTRSVEWKPLDEEIARQYIGGKGYGTRLLYDLTDAGVDPLGPANPLIFATGPLNGSVAPQSNRFAVVCKSPLTGGIGNATCGGSFSFGMKKGGIDVLVVRGAADAPVRLEIDGDAGEVRFEDARELWGLGTYETQKRLGKLPTKGWNHAVIGPAGENLVRYAGIVSNERIAGPHGRRRGDGLEEAQGRVACAARASSTWRTRPSSRSTPRRSARSSRTTRCSARA